MLPIPHITYTASNNKMISELDRMWKKAVMTRFEVLVFCQERKKKTTYHLHQNRKSLDQDLKLQPSKNKAGVLPTQP